MRKCNKLNSIGGVDLMFFCPGCQCAHGISTSVWKWNGDLEKPTLTPSILSEGEKRCHSFITDGKIKFLLDCYHELKGKTVDLPDWDTKFD